MSPVVARACEGIQKALQGRRPFRFKHIAFTHKPTRQLSSFKSNPQSFCLGVLADQTTNIPRCQGPFFVVRPQDQLLLQERLAGGCNLLFQQVGLQLQDLEWRLIFGELECPFLRLCFHCRDRQAGALQSWLHQPIQGLHQRRAGTSIFIKPETGFRRGRRQFVGGEFAAPESINRLFGVSDDHQEMAARSPPKGAFKDAPLDGIGVLKLIDQCCAVTLGNGPQQRSDVVAGSGIEAFEKLPKTDLSAAFTSSPQFATSPVAEMQQQSFGRAIHQKGDALHQFLLG